jgi:hypothetical protein
MLRRWPVFSGGISMPEGAEPLEEIAAGRMAAAA